MWNGKSRKMGKLEKCVCVCGKCENALLKSLALIAFAHLTTNLELAALKMTSSGD